MCTFSCKRVLTTYAGPTLKLRGSNGSATGTNLEADFYADQLGNLGLSINGTGTSLASWMSSNGHTYVTVSIWYDQSGNVKNATQPTTTLQPRYNTANYVIDFGNTTTANTNGFFILPNRTLPANNVPSTAVYRVVVNGGVGGGGYAENGVCVGGNEGTNNAAYVLFIANKNSYAFSQWGAAATTGANSYIAGMTTITVKLTASSSTQSVTQYLNGTVTSNSPQTLSTLGYGTYTQTDAIGTDRNGKDGNGNGSFTSADQQSFGLNGYMAHISFFNIALSDADRIIVENQSATVLDKLSARSTAVAVYSLQQLSGKYSGKIVNLTNSANSSSSDFYADANGNLWTGQGGTGTSLSSWLGAGTASVNTWYDQSGKGNNITTNGTAPVYNASLINSKPALNFANTAGLASTAFTNASSVTLIMVINIQNTIQNWGNFCHHGHRDTDFSLEQNGQNSSYIHWQTKDDNSGDQLAIIYNTPVICYCTMENGIVMNFQMITSGGTSTTSATYTVQSFTSGSKAMYVGKSYPNNEACNSYIGELMYFQSVLSANDKATIIANISSRWGISTI
jgi:hypothetical protein